MHTVSTGVRTDLGGDYGDDGYGAKDIVDGTDDAEGAHPAAGLPTQS